MATFDNTNPIFGGIIYTSPALSGTITVTPEGIVTNTSGIAVELEGGAYTLAINGLVDGSTTGVALGTAATASRVTVGTTGYLNGGSGFSLYATHAVNLTNSGVMDSAQGIFIDGGALSFSLTNSGVIYTSGLGIDLRGSAAAIHTITNNETIFGYVDASQSFGADRLNNFGLINNYVALGEGANYFVNKGQVNGYVAMGSGVDNFYNYAEVLGPVTTGGGNDIVTNNKTFVDTIETGAGNDKYTNAGEVLGAKDYGSAISLGKDDDILVSGKYRDFVIDEDGKDNYALGDAIDTFYAVNLDGGVNTGSASKDLAGKYDIDTIDGQTNTGSDLKLGVNSIFGDIYDASNAVENIVLNLDSAARFDIFNGATTANNKAAYTGTSTEIGTDIVKGFEYILLGDGADLVFGGAAHEKIDSGAGNDTIYGGKGNDYLIGGDDQDQILGEAGRDMLEGGADADTFIYRAIADSTVALAGRDRILDFEDGLDEINVEFLTAVPFTFLGVDAAFTPTAVPELRILTTNFGWTLQFDSNGDSKVDMAIDVQDYGHAISWDAADFSL